MATKKELQIEWGVRRTPAGFKAIRTCGSVEGQPFWWDDDAAAMAVEVDGSIYFDAYDVNSAEISALFEAIDAAAEASTTPREEYDEF